MLRPYDDPTDHHKINVKPGSLGAIIRSYKSAVTYRINKEHNATGIWQRNYYEHIIRNDVDLQNKTDYILANPLLWDEDDENPINANQHPRATKVTCLSSSFSLQWDVSCCSKTKVVSWLKRQFRLFL